MLTPHSSRHGAEGSRRALILAAGTGSRLGELTATVPKPMIALGGEPIIESNVRLLMQHGFGDISINTHHLAETIRAYLGDGRAFGARLSYAYEPELLGTAGALVPLRAFFSTGTFAVVYGDNRSTCDLTAMLRLHRNSGAVVTIALWQRAGVTQSGVVRFSNDGRIDEFVEKPATVDDDTSSGDSWVNAGIYICEPAVIDLIAAEGSSDFGRDVFPLALARGVRLQGYPMVPPERLWWIDTPLDYERACADLEGRTR